jgi:hypothetical protein
MRRKSIGFASMGIWSTLVGCDDFVGCRVECTVGAGALLYISAKVGILCRCLDFLDTEFSDSLSRESDCFV